MESLRPIGRQDEDPAEPVLLRPFLITAVGASAFWTCIYAAVGARVPVVILLLGTAGFGLCLLARRRWSTPVVSHLALAVAFALIFDLIAVTGGITGITTPWLPVLTVFSVFLLAPAGTAGWGAILVLLTGALLLAEGAGFTFPTTIPENTVRPLFGVSVITAVTTSVVLVWFFARVQLRARRVVVEASRNLRKVLDAIPEPLIVLEPRGDGELRYAYGNEPMARLVGQDPTGLKLDEAGFALRQITRDFLGEGTTSDRRHVARKPVRVRGEERLLQVISQPLVESGEIRQVVPCWNSRSTWSTWRSRSPR